MNIFSFRKILISWILLFDLTLVFGLNQAWAEASKSSPSSRVSLKNVKKEDCYNYYEQAQDGIAPFSEALRVCNKFAKEGDPASQFILGLIYGYGQSVEQNFVLSAYWLDKAVELRYAPAYYYLGQLYMEGNGVELDYNKAFSLFSAGAQTGSADSMYALSQMYGNGFGTPLNQKLYIKWLERAAAAKNKQALFELAMLYFQGSLVNQDIGKTIELLEDAVKQDYRQAQFTLAMILSRGVPEEHIPGRPKYAFELLQRSAQGEYSPAQLQLGRVYELGLLGQIKNRSKALLWYSIACNNELEESCYHFQRLQEDSIVLDGNNYPSNEQFQELPTGG